MHRKHVLRQLVALQLGHLPKLIERWIVNDLHNATPDEIEARLTRNYVVVATKMAIAAARRKTAPPVVKQRPPAPRRPGGVRHVIVTSPPRPPAKEVRARARHLAKQMEFFFPSTEVRR
jgi:hypothetical protein